MDSMTPSPAHRTYKLGVYGAGDTVIAKRWVTFGAEDDTAARDIRQQVAVTLSDDEVVWLFRDGEPHPIATDTWTATEFPEVAA